jgi:plasmid stabilization system protein ParE
VPIVRRHPDFEIDYLALLDSIVNEGDAIWIDVLADGLERTVRLLATFPAAGAMVERKGTATLRKILFPRGPYLAWYVHDVGDVTADVWLVRLFHARQRRPATALRQRWATTLKRSSKKRRRH